MQLCLNGAAPGDKGDPGLVGLPGVAGDEGLHEKAKGKAEFTIKSCFVKEKKKKKRMKCNLQLYLIASFFEGQFICENVGFKVPSSVFLYIYFLRFPLVYFCG